MSNAIERSRSKRLLALGASAALVTGLVVPLAATTASAATNQISQANSTADLASATTVGPVGTAAANYVLTFRNSTGALEPLTAIGDLGVRVGASGAYTPLVGGTVTIAGSAATGTYRFDAVDWAQTGETALSRVRITVTKTAGDQNTSINWYAAIGNPAAPSGQWGPVRFAQYTTALDLPTTVTLQFVGPGGGLPKQTFRPGVPAPDPTTPNEFNQFVLARDDLNGPVLGLSAPVTGGPLAVSTPATTPATITNIAPLGPVSTAGLGQAIYQFQPQGTTPAAGSLTYTAVLQVSGGVTKSAQLTQQAAGRLRIPGSDLLIVDQNGVLPAGIVLDDPTFGARDYTVSVAVRTFPFRVTGLVAGASYGVTATVNDGTGVSLPATITAGSDGTATFNVQVTTAPAATTQIIVFVDGTTATGGAASISAWLRYAPVALATPLQTSPANGTVYFATSGATVPVSVAVTSNFGTPISGAPLTVAVNGTVVASGSSANDGTATFSVVANADNAQVTVTATNPLAPSQTSSSTFRIRLATPTIAFNTTNPGVTVPGATVTRPVPSDDTLVAYPWFQNRPVKATLLGLNVTAGGAAAAGAVVTLTGDEGVRFVTTSGATLQDAGTAVSWTQSKVSVQVTTGPGGLLGEPDSTGQRTFVYAFSTKSGVKKITASVNGSTSVTTTGNFTAYAEAPSARNISVSGPDRLTSGQVGTYIYTVTDTWGNTVEGAVFNLQIPADSPGRFTTGSRFTVQPTDKNGQVAVDVQTATTEKGTLKINVLDDQLPVLNSFINATQKQQYGALANSLYEKNNISNDAPGFTASNVPSTKSVEIAAGGTGVRTALIVSPTNGMSISSGGYFNVYATTTGSVGQTAYLTLNGFAKASVKVGTDGVALFNKIPAEVGTYRVRIGAADDPDKAESTNSFALNIKLFSLKTYSQSGSKTTFQIATGNWSAGTTVTVTRNGIAVATGKVAQRGAPIAVSVTTRPGTYQVRVNSKQGFVYGATDGVIVLS